MEFEGTQGEWRTGKSSDNQESTKPIIMEFIYVLSNEYGNREGNSLSRRNDTLDLY